MSKEKNQMPSSRKGTLVEPRPRLDNRRVRDLHAASLELLKDPGIECHNGRAADLYARGGGRVTKTGEDVWRVSLPAALVEKAAAAAPKRVVLGARDPRNRLVLDADIPRVYFGTGAETNIYLDTDMVEFRAENGEIPARRLPVHTRRRGSLERLCRAARLCDRLENVDFFIRNVNIQDEDITSDTKDVNMFRAALTHIGKHVQAGLVNIDRLDDVLELAAMMAGGKPALEENPILSFITCVIKSPLQMVEDTTEKLIAICERGIPVVISSSPQGGTTAPIREEGIVALINAEILAGITLTQIVREGTPVLYGAVPVRARMDTLHDLYGAPEFIHYNQDCVQMARRYGIPCYSTAGAGDARVPGLQATLEKVFSHLEIAASGAQYIHYAFGLLDKTNVFSPLQAVLDDAQVGTVRRILTPPAFRDEDTRAAVDEVRRVFSSSTRLFTRGIRRAMRRGLVSPPYPFESFEDSDRVLEKAQQRVEEIMSDPGTSIPMELTDRIHAKIPGLLAPDRFKINSSISKEEVHAGHSEKN